MKWARDKGYGKDADKALSGFRYKNEVPPLPRDLADKLFKPGGRFFGSVTRFENYRRCPYMYFIRYGLKIDKRDEGEMEALDFGNYLHAGLHQFGQALKKKKSSGGTPQTRTSRPFPPPSPPAWPPRFITAPSTLTAPPATPKGH